MDPRTVMSELLQIMTRADGIAQLASDEIHRGGLSRLSLIETIARDIKRAASAMHDDIDGGPGCRPAQTGAEVRQ